MNSVKERLEIAFNHLALIPVSGEYVDYMATARLALREVFQMLPDEEPKESKKPETEVK